MSDQDSILARIGTRGRRVQLRELQEERTLLSLTTRRQRNYFDNRSDDPTLTRNESREQAAGNNPYLQGQTNYRPDQLSALLFLSCGERVKTERSRWIALRCPQPSRDFS